MKYKNIILIGLILFSFYSCSDDDDLHKNEIRFFWNQTKCADPWGTGQNSTNEETEIALRLFLEDKNVTVQSVGFDTNSPLATDCESCGCGTEKRIIVDVIDSDIPKMKALEFYQ